jgi:hypothetical protein
VLAGHRLGGGLIEPCDGYAGLREARAIHMQWLAREFFGFDGTRVVLLHGYSKRAGQAASRRDLDRAFAYWTVYTRTRRISPIQVPRCAAGAPAGMKMGVCWRATRAAGTVVVPQLVRRAWIQV